MVKKIVKNIVRIYYGKIDTKTIIVYNVYQN